MALHRLVKQANGINTAIANDNFQPLVHGGLSTQLYLYLIPKNRLKLENGAQLIDRLLVLETKHSKDLLVNDLTALLHNCPASNGYIHTIDQVLIPTHV
jgi:uncharacterized surface protein with fasciclin (FAS1) repeats